MGSRGNERSAHSPDRDNRHANRDVITRHTPPAPRASFEQEQRAIRDNNNRPLPHRDLRNDGQSNERNDIIRTSSADIGRSAGQRSGNWSRDDHPQRIFNRPQEASRSSPQSPGQPSGQASRQPAATVPQADNRSRDNFPRERDVARVESPRSEMPRTESPRTESPAARASPEPQERRQIERQFNRQPERQPDRQIESQVGRHLDRQFERQFEQRSEPRTERRAETQWQRPSANQERPQPVERAQRYEAPQQQQQQRAERPQQQQQAPAASEQRQERHDGRGNRHTMER
jgi:hypothetical protein